MEKPMFSIVTIVFNDDEKITETIDSVIGQKNCSFEYIVVDGASTDTTLSIIHSYGDKINKVISEPDAGIYQAMNKGVKLAKGEYVLLMNSGDRIVDFFILSKVRVAIDLLQPDIVYGDVLRLNSDKEFKEKISEPPGNKHRMYFCHQSAFVKTDLLQRQPFDEKYKMSADFKFFKQAYNEGLSFHHLKFPVAFFDQTGVSNKSRVKGLKENVQIIKECDKGIERFRLLARIFPSYILSVLKIRWRENFNKLKFLFLQCICL